MDVVRTGHKGPGNFCSAILISQGQYTQNWDGDGPRMGPMHTLSLRGYSKRPQWFLCPNSLLVLGSQRRSLFTGPLRLELVTADGASLMMPKVPEGMRDREQQIEYGMQGRRDENWGRRAAFLGHFRFGSTVLEQTCTSVVKRWPV